MPDIIKPFDTQQPENFCPFLSTIAILADQFGAPKATQAMTPCNPMCAIYEKSTERCGLIRTQEKS